MKRTLFFSAHEKPPEKIPLPSQEAFEILYSNNRFSKFSKFTEIFDLVNRFKLLVNPTESILTSHHFGNGPLNNLEFISNLDAIMKRLTDAMNKGKPYACLFGDVVQLKEYLQVILGYYQAQLAQQLPDIKLYQREISHPSSSFQKLIGAIGQHEKPILDDEESQMIATYIIRNHAKSNMKSDMKKITEIILTPFLKDHEEGFSYSSQPAL